MTFAKPHVHLNISDVEASVAFYVKLLGCEPKRRRPDGASFEVFDPPLFLVLQQEPRTGVNAGHFGLLVDDEARLEQALTELQSRGLQPERRAHKLWLEDPDQNGWEILVTP